MSEKNSTQKNCHTGVSDMMKLYSLLLILTQKSSWLSEICVSVDNNGSKNFASKYFLEVNVVVIITNPPSMINHMLPIELVIIYS